MPTAKKHRSRKSQASISLHCTRLIIATNRGPVEFEISKDRKAGSEAAAGEGNWISLFHRGDAEVKEKNFERSIF